MNAFKILRQGRVCSFALGLFLILAAIPAIASAREIKIVKNQPQILDVATYLELVELVDSRCPRTVTCYWEGQIEATFSFMQNDTAKKFSLVLHPEKPNLADIASFKIRIKKVDPYPQTPDESSDKAVVTLQVERVEK